jgi:hypothetical protein
LCLDRSVDVAVDVIGADPVDDPDDLANDAEREPLASYAPDTDRILGLIAGTLATLDRVSRY